MNRKSRVLDIMAGNKLDSLQNGLEAFNAMEQHPFSLKSRIACEIFSGWFPFPINFILSPTEFLRVLEGSFIALPGAQHPFLLPHSFLSYFNCVKSIFILYF
jgi:hypothetical protein